MTVKKFKYNNKNESTRKTVMLAMDKTNNTMADNWITGLIDWLIVDWLIDYDRARLCLRTGATNGPIVHPPGDMWAWRAMVMTMMMLAGDNSSLVHQSSLAVLPAETSGASTRKGRSEDFAFQYLKYLKGPLICRKILRHGPSGFTSHPKERVLRIFIALKNPSSRPGFNPRPWVQWQAH
jgi:hypothetical protein